MLTISFVPDMDFKGKIQNKAKAWEHVADMSETNKWWERSFCFDTNI